MFYSMMIYQKKKKDKTILCLLSTHSASPDRTPHPYSRPMNDKADALTRP